MSGYYILDGKEPVKMPDAITWATRFETAGRTVKKTALGENVLVLTILLGIDYRFSDGPPLLFETMIFDGEYDKGWRYSTWDEAVAGHDVAVAQLTKEKATAPPGPVAT